MTIISGLIAGALFGRGVSRKDPYLMAGGIVIFTLTMIYIFR